MNKFILIIILYSYCNIWINAVVVKKKLMEPNDQLIKDIGADDLKITSDSEWPKPLSVGHVSGVSLDVNENVYVFHRGPRVWDGSTFDPNNVYNSIDWGPISIYTVAVISSKTGELLYEWGKDIFYLPHGITVDQTGNIWVTDVALHQVFKFPPLLSSKNDNKYPLLTLGTKLQPGDSNTHFCKPTAVAVLTSGDFFVSDGYCNSRIIKYSSDGTILTQWGRSSMVSSMVGAAPLPPYQFFVAHDLTLAEDKNLVCVSDRENHRIQCFQINNGTFAFQIQSRDIGSRIFSASYTPANGGLLFIINDPQSIYESKSHGTVVSIDSNNFKVLRTFAPKMKTESSFYLPHDLIVSSNGSSMYIAELRKSGILKFNIEGTQVEPLTALGRYVKSSERNSVESSGNSGTTLVAILIIAVVLCFGAILIATALLYTKAKSSRGCTGHCKNSKWPSGNSDSGFKIGNLLGQHQGFVKLNNFEISDDDEPPRSESTPSHA